MHWTVECSEKLQEAKLQTAKLEKLLDSELPCKKDIHDGVELMQLKWDEFERAHFNHRGVQSNGMRDIMDQIHHEAATKYDAVMEALARKNAMIDADETAARKAAEEKAIDAAVKKAEEEAEAAAVKETFEKFKGAEEVIEKAAAVKETKEKKAEAEATIATKRTPLPLYIIAAETARIAKKAEEAAVKKAAENDAVAAATKMKAADEAATATNESSVAAPQNKEKDAEEDMMLLNEMKINPSQKSGVTTMNMKITLEGKKVKNKAAAAALRKVEQKAVAAAKEKATEEPAAKINAEKDHEPVDKIEEMTDVDTSKTKMETPAEAKESDADVPEAIETRKANEATSATMTPLPLHIIAAAAAKKRIQEDTAAATAKKKAVLEASINPQKGKAAVDAKIPLSPPASSHHNNTSLQSYREEEHDDNQEVVPVKSKPRDPPPTSTSMSSSVDNNHAVQQYGDPATPMAPPGGGTVALDNTCDADDRYDYGQYGDDSMSGYDDAGGMINPNTGMPVSKGQLNNVKKRCGTLLTLGELGIKCIVRNDTDGTYGQAMEGLHACQDSTYTRKYKASGHEYNKKYREDGHLFNKSAKGGQLGYDNGKLTFSVSKFDPGGTFRQVNAATGFKQLVPRPENENMFGGRSNSEVDSLENEDLTSSDRQTNMKLGRSLVDRVTTGVNRYG